MNNRGQIGETMTWVVGTLVIIVILAISIFIVSSRVFENDRTIKAVNLNSNLLVTKSLLGYLSTGDNFEQLRNEKTYLENPSSIVKIDKTLAQKVLFGLYKDKDYSAGLISFGISSEGCLWNPLIQANPCATASNTKILLGEGNLVPGKKATKFFYDYVKLKDVGDKAKNTVVELMLN